ncbi:SpoVR family protein [Lutibaculum baratangense]|uniref:SpoVR-like protein n=1 Tax=Lutibaculum baratangense AMV1 TaxID=631454 RepID=V4RC83_9HYPH|nr:SpoVR family protein [Lutibaculum baratangense]ESR22989.1 SpoVR-like protein [Lutibaculum baratangense AMV1]
MTPRIRAGRPYLYEGHEWDFDTLSGIYEAIEEVAHVELGLRTFANRIEVISAEQMLDAYASTGMPLMYNHWSFGKHFLRNETLYRKGWQSLAFEIVINSDPCLVYVMEENSATMQAIVLAHAAFGHNHFFRNNYLFRQWTDPTAILDYLAFAKKYVATCEERHGQEAVERLLDAAHALTSHGIHRYKGKQKADLSLEERREQERQDYRAAVFNDLWRTVPKRRESRERSSRARRRALLGLPEENILYFLENAAPRLVPWQREILRIVRTLAQYFYPQRQTKLMNEGCATFVHHRILPRLHERGQITDGAFMEYLHAHTNAVTQPNFDDPRFTGLNPYALGLAMMLDIERICTEPEEEDRAVFPDIAGCGDAYGVLRDAWANYRDESFIAQFLSPRLIRQLRLFQVVGDSAEGDLVVSAIHDERGYVQVRRALARQYDVSRQDPDIQIVDVDLVGDRELLLRHEVTNGIALDAGNAGRVLAHLANLWGYPVRLEETSHERVLETHEAQPTHPFGDQ